MRHFVSFLGAAALGISVANAADVPVKAPMMAPAYNWTGFYVGATGGYAWGNSVGFIAGGPAPNVKYNAFVSGGTIGYNWQFNQNGVIGIEADIQNGLKGSDPVGTAGGTSCNTGPCQLEVKYFGTVRARLGYAFDRTLVYATGGWAYGSFNGGIPPIDYGTGTKSGWAGGAGVEYAFMPGWSVKAEWLYVDFGTVGLGTGLGGPISQPVKFNDLRLGINYRFGG